jgi:hypothetical protein
MGRSIVAVIVGYIASFVLMLGVFIGAYIIVGTDWAFRTGSYMASNRWIALTMAANFVVSIIGGLICAVIAKGGRAPIGLAVVVLVLGMLLAIPSVMKHNANMGMVRHGNVSQAEAMKNAYWPVWVPFAFPIVGAVGVLIGGRLKRRD